jgi:membrane-associated phospholipid phosphatase
VHVESWLRAHATPGLDQVMLVVTVLGSLVFTAPVTVGVALLLALHRRWHKLAVLAMAVPGGMLLNVLLKVIFQRHRPVLEGPILSLSSFSFPSGHATVSVLLYGFLTVLLVTGVIRSWRWRVLAVLATVFLVAVVDFSRMYLGVHYLSDVLAGNTVGVAWLAICVTGMGTLRQIRRGKAEAQSAISNEPEGGSAPT